MFRVPYNLLITSARLYIEILITVEILLSNNYSETIKRKLYHLHEPLFSIKKASQRQKWLYEIPKFLVKQQRAQSCVPCGEFCSLPGEGPLFILLFFFDAFQVSFDVTIAIFHYFSLSVFNNDINRNFKRNVRFIFFFTVYYHSENGQKWQKYCSWVIHCF